jgi:hypothetical protein
LQLHEFHYSYRGKFSAGKYFYCIFIKKGMVEARCELQLNSMLMQLSPWNSEAELQVLFRVIGKEVLSQCINIHTTCSMCGDGGSFCYAPWFILGQ